MSYPISIGVEAAIAGSAPSPTTPTNDASKVRQVMICAL